MARIWRRKLALSLPMFTAQSSTIPGIGSWKNSPNRLSLSSFRFWKEKNKRQARDAQSALGQANICAVTDQVRIGDQSQNRQGNGPYNSFLGTYPRRRG